MRFTDLSFYLCAVEQRHTRPDFRVDFELAISVVLYPINFKLLCFEQTQRVESTILGEPAIDNTQTDSATSKMMEISAIVILHIGGTRIE